MTGINNVAACLVSRKLHGMFPDVRTKILGDGMDHSIWFQLPDGQEWTITNVRQWFKLRSELMLCLEKFVQEKTS